LKILHISTGDFGGAASAAIRIHESLLLQDVDSNLLLLNKTNYNGKNTFVFQSASNSIFEVPSLTLKNYLKERFFSTFSKQNQIKQLELANKKQFENKIALNSLKLFEVFSIPTSEFDITTSELYQQCDIIHIHWASGFLDLLSFFNKNSKPVVWSLYDEYPILGAFHYQEDVNRNVDNEFGKLDKLYQQAKLDVVSKCKELFPLAGSDWLKVKAQNSLIFKERRVTKIPYPVDITVFKYVEKGIAKNILNFDSSRKIFLFASSYISNKRKGFDLLLPIIESSNFANTTFLVMGTLERPLRSKNVIEFGKVFDERVLALVYSACDYFILPSLEENYSYSMIEALCCGTPVLAFDIGDHKSFLVNNEFGDVAESVDTLGLEKLISKAVNNEYNYNPEELSKKSQAIFNYKKIGFEMLNFYSKIYYNSKS
jgi:glycosyltransferase involved in cell wall biosynthesis